MTGAMPRPATRIPDGAALSRRALIAGAAAGFGLIGIGQARAAAPGPVATATAPEFTGISQWFNSPPLTMAGLRGKVVFVDFWTYGCINCVRTLPSVTKLDRLYRDRGLVIVGVHTPEFGFEKSAANVKAAIARHGIAYPVAQDNDYATWKAYNNHYWPAQYLVDRQGRIVYTHAGEGAYDTIEATIRNLLNAQS